MNDYRIKAMKLQNFCGIQSLEITPDGADIIVAITCIIMVWSFRGLLPQKKKARSRASAQKRKRQ